MKERPILFSTEMVKAILEERKTQTRRIMKPQPIHNNGWWVWEGTRPKAKYNSGLTAANYPPNKWLHPPTSPYGIPGDRLWVRETWRPTQCSMPTGWPYDYRATAEQDGAPSDGPWKPSIFMPREACRIMLEVTDVRIERLCDIADIDALREGVLRGQNIFNTGELRAAYRKLWEQINGKGSWEKNPWVWVIEFKKL